MLSRRFDTGDLGRIDVVGHVWSSGRAKDVIIRGGTTSIPPGSRGLARPSAVETAAAVGRPDALRRRYPVRFVQPKAGARRRPANCWPLRPA